MGHHSVGVGADTGPPLFLALRALGLGDALTGIPALRGLRRAYPHHRLLIACGPELGTWFTDLQLVDGVVPTHELDPIVDPPRPDVAVDLHGCGERSHEVLRRTNPRQLFGFGCAPPDFTPEPPWDGCAHEVDRWCDLVRWIGGPCGRSDLRITPPGRSCDTGPVVVHPGAAFASRRWPVPRWRRLVQELSGQQQVVVTGGPAEQARCAAVCRGTSAVTRAGRTPLPQLAALVASSRLVVSGDTGIAHLATAFGIPSVTLFGPVSPALWARRSTRRSTGVSGTEQGRRCPEIRTAKASTRTGGDHRARSGVSSGRPDGRHDTPPRHGRAPTHHVSVSATGRAR